MVLGPSAQEPIIRLTDSGFVYEKSAGKSRLFRRLQEGVYNTSGGSLSRLEARAWRYFQKKGLAQIGSLEEALWEVLSDCAPERRRALTHTIARVHLLGVSNVPKKSGFGGGEQLDRALVDSFRAKAIHLIAQPSDKVQSEMVLTNVFINAVEGSESAKLVRPYQAALLANLWEKDGANLEDFQAHPELWAEIQGMFDGTNVARDILKKSQDKPSLAPMLCFLFPKTVAAEDPSNQLVQNNKTAFESALNDGNPEILTQMKEGHWEECSEQVRYSSALMQMAKSLNIQASPIREEESFLGDLKQQWLNHSENQLEAYRASGNTDLINKLADEYNIVSQVFPENERKDLSGRFRACGELMAVKHEGVPINSSRVFNLDFVLQTKSAPLALAFSDGFGVSSFLLLVDQMSQVDTFEKFESLLRQLGALVFQTENILIDKGYEKLIQNLVDSAKFSFLKNLELRSAKARAVLEKQLRDGRLLQRIIESLNEEVLKDFLRYLPEHNAEALVQIAVQAARADPSKWEGFFKVWKNCYEAILKELSEQGKRELLREFSSKWSEAVANEVGKTNLSPEQKKTLIEQIGKLYK